MTVGSDHAVAPIRRPRISQRTFGRAMIAIGILGIVIGLTTVWVGQTMIRQVETSVDDSLRLTGEALTAVSDSIAVSESVVESVQTGMTGVRTTMATVEGTLDEASTALKQGGDFLGGSLPQALQAVNGVLPTIESVAKSVDDTLELLDEVPFGPNYQPVEPFDAAIARLSTALTPIPDQLRALSVNFKDLTTATSTMSDDVARLGTDIAALNTQLADVGLLLDRYADTTVEAKKLTRSSRADLARSADLTRWLLVLFGLVFALGQVVPIWLGSMLLADDGVARRIIRRKTRWRASSV